MKAYVVTFTWREGGQEEPAVYLSWGAALDGMMRMIHNTVGHSSDRIARIEHVYESDFVDPEDHYGAMLHAMLEANMGFTVMVWEVGVQGS